MSLVNEALKRARTQAAIQQSASNPLSHLAAQSHYSEPKRSYAQYVLIGLVACGFVGLVSAAVLHLRKTENVVAQADAAPMVQQSPVVEPRVSLPTPPAPAAPVVAPVPPPADTVRLAEPAAPPTAAEATAPMEKIETTPPPPTQPALVEGKVYIQTLDVADAPKLRLDGILWSDKNPLALVNGISAAPGDDLGGVSIVAIEPKRVKFEAQGKQFYLRLP